MLCHPARHAVAVSMSVPIGLRFIVYCAKSQLLSDCAFFKRHLFNDSPEHVLINGKYKLPPVGIDSFPIGKRRDCFEIFGRERAFLESLDELLRRRACRVGHSLGRRGRRVALAGRLSAPVANTRGASGQEPR